MCIEQRKLMEFSNNCQSHWEKATLPFLPEEVELVATAMRATDNTKKDQREDDYENVVKNGYRVLSQDKHVDGQELFIKVIINEHGKGYFKEIVILRTNLIKM